MQNGMQNGCYVAREDPTLTRCTAGPTSEVCSNTNAAGGTPARDASKCRALRRESPAIRHNAERQDMTRYLLLFQLQPRTRAAIGGSIFRSSLFAL